MERNNMFGKIGGLDNDLSIADENDPHQISHAEAEKLSERLDQDHDGIGFPHKVYANGKIVKSTGAYVPQTADIKPGN